ncbi:phage baseplate assembly protein V [Paraburkholderia sp.]|uniref:phage baseplate assembly protein V n=1 Tax=Paraburkholderia sp. TaxID=1926495 RepID=UPI002D43571C|nr:phage baseplate assembly protein V [Paraburkholderia sp.]HZZ03048.1 phage baseplate assembly protein V [Paraburkholderia sp.]
MSDHVFATGEHGRMLSNVAMIGVVAQLDEANARVTVYADDLTTDWLPWLTRRAGSDSDWWAPEPGEQVVVLCPYGDSSQGVVIGSIYQDAFPPPANVRTIWRKKFADGSTVTYDRQAHALTVDVGSGSVTVNCATATVKATDTVTLDAPHTHCTGGLTVDGDTSMKGNADVQGNTTVKAITSNGVNVSNSHKHGNGNGGGPTTAVIG